MHPLPPNSQQDLYHGYPPWHSVVLIATFVVAFLQFLPSGEAWDSNANYETFSKVLFPTILPLSAVISIRLVFAVIIFADIFRASSLVVFDHESEYFPSSKLRAGAPISYRGVLTKEGTLASGAIGIASFTTVSWLMEGFAFFLAALIPLLELESHGTIYKVALVLWELVAPCAFLISLVVTYVLWPFAKAANAAGKKGNLELLNRLGPLLAHNLNVLAIATELSILGGIPIRPGHFALAPLYGSAYVVFSWTMKHKWLPLLAPEERQKWGPQYLYPFMDTSLGWVHTFSLLALLCVLLISHFGVCGLQYVIHSLNSEPEHQHKIIVDELDSGAELAFFGTQSLVIIGVFTFVCRFR